MFPKIVRMYLHADKADMYNKGIELGLSENKAIEFSHCLYELAVDIRLYENGKYKIIGCKET